MTFQNKNKISVSSLQTLTLPLVSHKGERRQKYSMEFKKATIKYAQENSIHSAAKKFKVDRKRVREWVQKEDKVTSVKGKRFRLDGGGRKLTDVELEEEVLSWIQ